MTSYAAEPDPIATYTDRAGVPLTIHRTTGGEADFIGAKRAAAEPLGASVAPEKAARTHLGRADDALGTDDLDLREQDTTAAVGGGSVTRFGQYVDGLPVLGGEGRPRPRRGAWPHLGVDQPLRCHLGEGRER